MTSDGPTGAALTDLARRAVADEDRPVAVVRGFGAASRSWAAAMRARLADQGVATLDFKPLPAGQHLPTAAAVVLGPGMPVTEAFREAALQDIPVLAAPGHREDPARLLSARLDPPPHPERRHVALGRLFLMPLIKGSTLQVYADGTSVDVRDDAPYALGIHDQQVVVRVHPDRPEGARPASAPSVHGRRVRLSCRRGRYSVNADNTLVDELGRDQALAVQLVQVEVRTATVTDTTA